MNSFSIIIPIYNGEKYLNEAVSSILNQKYEDYEIILIDDGSTDATKKICQRFENNDNVKYLYKSNGGVSSARNLGILNATKEYLMFMDADDLLAYDSLDYFNTLIEKNKNPDIVSALICGDKKQLGTNEDAIESCHIPDKSDLIYKILNYNFLSNCKLGNLRSSCARVYKNSLIKNSKILFDTRLKIGEDMAFFLEAAINAKEIVIGNKYIYYYRKNELSVMQTLTWKGSIQSDLYINKVKSILKKNGYRCDIISIFFETCERDWLTIIQGNIPLKEKLKILSDLCEQENYIYFSKHPSNNLGLLFKLYLFSIRKRQVLLWFFLIELKSFKLKSNRRTEFAFKQLEEKC